MSLYVLLLPVAYTNAFNLFPYYALQSYFNIKRLFIHERKEVSGSAACVKQWNQQQHTRYNLRLR